MNLKDYFMKTLGMTAKEADDLVHNPPPDAASALAGYEMQKAQAELHRQMVLQQAMTNVYSHPVIGPPPPPPTPPKPAFRPRTSFGTDNETLRAMRERTRTVKDYMHFYDKDGNLAFSLKADGTFQKGPAFTTAEEAAMQFWEAVTETNAMFMFREVWSQQDGATEAHTSITQAQMPSHSLGQAHGHGPLHQHSIYATDSTKDLW